MKDATVHLGRLRPWLHIETAARRPLRVQKLSARAINRHAGVAEQIPKTNPYENDFTLVRGVARVMSAPAKLYALAVVSFNAASTRCR